MSIKKIKYYHDYVSDKTNMDSSRVLESKCKPNHKCTYYNRVESFQTKISDIMVLRRISYIKVRRNKSCFWCKTPLTHTSYISYRNGCINHLLLMAQLN